LVFHIAVMGVVHAVLELVVGMSLGHMHASSSRDRYPH
jgi:hypothetical protein